MNCGNCGTPLAPGNNICPKCGALNMGFGINLNNVNPQPVNVANNISNVPSDDDAPTSVLQGLKSDSSNYINTNQVSENTQVQEEVRQNLNPETNEINNNEEIQENSNVNEEVSEAEVQTEDATIDSQVSNIEDDNIVNNANIKQDIPIADAVMPIETELITQDENSEVESQDNIDENKDEVAELSNDINSKKKLKLKIKFKSNKKVPLPICAGGLVLAIILGILLGSSLFSKNYCAVSNNVFNNSTQVVADGKNNITQIGHFVYKVPNIYQYDRESGGLSIYDSDSSYKIFVKTQQGSYDNITASKTSIKATLTEQGIIINNIKEMKVENKKYFIVEAQTKNINRMLVFTDASEGYVYYSEIMTFNNEYNYDLLKILNDILINAAYDEKEVSTMEKIDVFDPSLVVIKASNEYKDKINPTE